MVRTRRDSRRKKTLLIRLGVNPKRMTEVDDLSVDQRSVPPGRDGRRKPAPSRGHLNIL